MTKVIIRRDGRIIVNGTETRFYAACSLFPGYKRHHWYIEIPGIKALFRTRGQLRQAIATFIESAESYRPNEPLSDTLTLCAISGSSRIIST